MYLKFVGNSYKETCSTSPYKFQVILQKGVVMKISKTRAKSCEHSWTLTKHQNVKIFSL